MPRACGPGVLCDVVIDYDKGAPEETRPTFVVRMPSRDQAQVITTALYSSAGQATVNERYDRLIEALTPVLAGWRNMIDATGAAIDFDVSRLGSFMTWRDLVELAQETILASIISRDDKKKLESSP